ncbi:MAG: hypothetical protein J7M34_05195, partial [Anaerolineae bacterium]|nr:hypothetical protein [Anaerolineae bacterium]
MERGTRQPNIQLEGLDAARLTPIVRQVLDTPTAVVMEWKTERLSGGIGMGTAVYHLSGQAQDDGQTTPWS